MRTGIFFHEEFRSKDWPIIGDKFYNFPAVLKRVLTLDGVHLFESKPATEDVLLKTHTESYLRDVRKNWYFKGASLAVGGCVEAAERIARGELVNALVFSVAAGHHCSPASGWGGTYLSCTGPAVAHLRDLFGHRRFAIIDTDSHHGDGTRAVFRDDPDVLHVCFCSDDTTEGQGTKIDVDVGYATTDEAYLQAVRKEFIGRLREFKPFLIFHNFGHDTGQGDYGDRGLTLSFFPRLAEEVKKGAEEVCQGRYLIITHGGYLADVAESIFPRIAEILVCPAQAR